jgi:hypothetical protein
LRPVRVEKIRADLSFTAGRRLLCQDRNNFYCGLMMLLTVTKFLFINSSRGEKSPSQDRTGIMPPNTARPKALYGKEIADLALILKGTRQKQRLNPDGRE